MTDRKLTCVACKSAVTKGDIAHTDLEFGGELKATNQPTYTADADTDLVATVGTLDEYTPMVRTSGDQVKSGRLDFISYIGAVVKANNIDVTTAPSVSQFKPFILLRDVNDAEMVTAYFYQDTSNKQGVDIDFVRETTIRCRLHIEINADGGALLNFQTPKGTVTLADTR